MPTPVGCRVGAILSGSEESVNLLGYGVYVGREIPPADGHGFCSSIHEAGFTNPKIVLDDGQVVWGAECWWGPEEQIKAMLAGKKVVQVDIPAWRVRKDGGITGAGG